MAHIGTPLIGNSTTNATSQTFTFSSAVSTGHTLIGTVNVTELTSSPTFTVTDSKGNTYSVDAQVTSATTDVVAVFSAPITVALTTSDTITVQLSDGNHNRWAISVEDFDDILASPKDKTSTGVATGTSSMSSGTTAATTNTNELVFGGFGFTNGPTQTFTPGAGFTNSTLQTTTGTTIRSVCNEWKYINSTGTQTATATLSSNSTWGAVCVTYKSQAVANSIPTANAGVDQSVVAQQTVTLDGTASSDSDGSVVAYSWTQISGTTVTLSNANASQPTFLSPASGSGATLVFGLVVTDNSGDDSVQDTVTITVAAAVGHVATPIVGAFATSAVTSKAFTVSQAVVAGHSLVGTVEVDFNTGVAQPVLTVTDSKSNTYTIDNYVAVTSTLFVAIFSGRLTTALTTSDTLTVSDSATTRTRWIASVEEYDNLITTATPLDKTLSNSGHSTSLTTTTSAVTSSSSELIFAGFGYAVPSAQTFTVGAGYTASTQQATSNGTTDRAVTNEWRYVNSTGTQTATGTITASANYGALMATYKCINTSGNTLPTANAGADQSVTTSTSVTLDGSASADPDGSIASYSWRQISGTSVSLSSTTVQKPTFTSPGSTATLVFGLTVTDNLGGVSPEDTVTVLVGSHAGYVAEAAFGTKTTSGLSFALTFNKTVSSGHTLLIGAAVESFGGDLSTVTASDSKGNTYTRNVTITNSTTVGTAIFSAYITTPLTTSDTLTLTDSTHTHSRWAVSASEFDNIIQNGFDVAASATGHSTSPASGSTATTQNTYEVIYGVAGFARSSAQNVTVNSSYSLAKFIYTSAGTTDRAMASMYRYFSTSSTFNASASLSGTSTWATAVATYTATSLGNLPPVASAGTDQSVAPFVTVTLDGSASYDPDGVVSSYLWSQTAGTTVTLSSTTVAQPTFTSPGVDGGSTLTFSLTVTDNSGTGSIAATVNVVVASATEFVLKSGSWQGAQVYDLKGGAWV